MFRHQCFGTDLDLSLHLSPPRILDVVVMKTYRLRGQAWIVFADVAASTNARNAMQGFPFYDKPLVSQLSAAPILTLNHPWIAICEATCPLKVLLPF